MSDREKIIKGLECCHVQQNEVPPLCEDCPYMNPMDGTCDALDELLGDALTLLKAQEPRVMTPEEVMSTGPEDVCGIVEIIEEEHMYGCYMRRYDEGHVELLCDVPNLPERLRKGCARIWTARPTDDQRKAVKWDDA